MNQVQMMKMLVTQLQKTNPQMANEINNIIEGKSEPQNVVKHIMSGLSPYQKQDVLNQARSLGVPVNVIEEVQNM